MGLIKSILGIGHIAKDISEVFVENKTKSASFAHSRFERTQSSFQNEFKLYEGRFDRFVNAINRLPRPLMVFGTFGLFAYAMVSPDEFTIKMQGLSHVPEPLWWLMAAIVSFYFGAREMHHIRYNAPRANVPRPEAQSSTLDNKKTLDHNAAIEDWHRKNKK